MSGRSWVLQSSCLGVKGQESGNGAKFKDFPDSVVDARDNKLSLLILNTSKGSVLESLSELPFRRIIVCVLDLQRRSHFGVQQQAQSTSRLARYRTGEEAERYSAFLKEVMDGFAGDVVLEILREVRPLPTAVKNTLD